MGSINMSDINIDPLVFTLAAQTEEESYGEQFEIVSRVAHLVDVPNRNLESNHIFTQTGTFNRIYIERIVRTIRNLYILITHNERIFIIKTCHDRQLKSEVLMDDMRIFNNEAMPRN